MARQEIEFEAFDRGQIGNLEAKQGVARRVAGEVRPGDVIGAGSGSTAWLAIHAIASRVELGQLSDVTLIPTSIEGQLTIAALASHRPGLRIGDLNLNDPDWLFDGADEVDPDGNLIKGRGGALFREKILFRATADRRVLIDASKRVERLGESFPVPVEVIPAALPILARPLTSLGATGMKFRTGSGKDGPVITESGNLLVDCRFERIESGLEAAIKQITGVVESGLFQGYDPTIISV
ncbi:MAG: ribose 5-phosphate isomerase A [Solirubrobacterales bacterium]|nr:ribose 5-phosphate isomerase A [Solirubrobacterales bacterium]